MTDALGKNAGQRIRNAWHRDILEVGKLGVKIDEPEPKEFYGVLRTSTISLAIQHEALIFSESDLFENRGGENKETKALFLQEHCASVYCCC